MKRQLLNLFKVANSHDKTKLSFLSVSQSISLSVSVCLSLSVSLCNSSNPDISHD